MFNASQLTPGQIDSLRACAAGGGSMSDMQKLLKEDFGISITYMDTRFLILDLGIELIEESKGKEEAPADETPMKPEGNSVEGAPSSGGVVLDMDHLALPGALVSGSVTFSDGETAVWMIDQTGRMGLDPDTAGYRPSPEDITQFQEKLRNLLEKGGF